MARRTPQSDGAGRHLVVIGSSAGGIDALSGLLAHVPTPFPAPIVIAQHVDPRRPSRLAEILGAASAIPVHLAVDEGATTLEPGNAYIVPANRHVEIDDHQMRLIENGGGRPMPSVDRLFETAASAYGEGVVAVILSGAGSDGATGARHVKLAGGTVVIQNPSTASFPAMPMSLAPTTVDVVADVEGIGDLLLELMRGGYVPTKTDDEALLKGFLDDVRDATGIDFARYKRPTILRRLHRRMVAVGTGTLLDYVRHVHAHPEEMQRLAASLLIKVTEFFRDPELYRYLGDRVIPALVAEAAERGGELRFWSAGCATGEEAYSLAILASEAIGDRSDIRLRVFATDVDYEAIEFARRGIYPAEALNRMPEELRERYFTRTNGYYETKPAVRGLVAFGQHDLAQRAPFPRIDLAVCRNVLIYFTHELQRRALQLFAFALRDGGYLALGKAETSSPLGDHFVVENPRVKVYRRQGMRVVLPPQRESELLRDQHRTVSSRVRLAHDVQSGRFGADLERARSQAARADSLLLHMPYGVVVVDRKYDIVSINSAARSMLGVHGAAIGQDLVHLARGVSSIQLRRGIDTAFRGEPWRETWDIPAAETVTPDVRSLEVNAYRQTDGAEGQHVVLVIRDVSTERGAAQRLEAELAQQRRRADAMTAQLERMRELAVTLREANEELTLSNAELRAQNDELVVSNEEVQAATEEVETLNEEMQATNEELETLNEEMQATVEELNTTNDDLEARSNELQSLALSLEKQREVSEAERARLAAILSSMADAVMVVAPDGEIVLTNEAFDRVIPFGPDAAFETDDGRPLTADEMPRTRAARGEEFSMSVTFVPAGGERRWFEAHGAPIAGDGGGGVVVIRDITDRSLQRLQADFLSMLSHELRTPLTGLTAYLELLHRKQSREDGTDVRYLERAMAQARRFAGLVDELFDANRLRSGRMSYEFEEVDLARLVDDAVAIARTIDEDRTISIDPGSAKLVVRGDAHRLQQVVFNLVANALRHAPDSSVEIRLRKRGRQAELCVEDHGPGIEPGMAERMFHRLEGTGGAGLGGGGLGLGLYITHGIVDAHGGTIDVDSTLGEGTTFRVRLPLA